ncbi:MAG TPA: hypothetical protein VES65_03810 [Solirubrobacteraceae bacterium]|nr:hypothetical protein [Solirubrobacteraceae bacterium]
MALSGGLSSSRRPWPTAGALGLERVVARRSWAVFWWLPVLCAVVYAAAVLANFHDIITSVYLNSDVAVAPVLGQAIGHIPAGSYVSLGNHAWYEEWLFLLATRRLPAHLQLWERAPMLWSLLGLGILVWTARRALDTWSAALCGAALVCVGAFGRFCFLAIEWHSLSLVHTILIVGVSVWLVPQVHAISWRRLIVVAVGLGVLSAFPTASDGLFPFWALAPLVGATAIVAWRSPPRARARLATFAAVVVGVAAIGAVALSSVMRHSGITSRVLSVASVALDEVGHNMALLADSYAYLAGGRILAPSVEVQSVLVFASAALVLIALVLVLDQVRRILGTRSIRHGMTDARLVYVAFWSISLVATSLVFVLSDAPKDALSGRYLLAGYAAIAALLPLVATRSSHTRATVTAGVCVFALIAAYQVIRRPFEVVTPPDASVTFPGPSTASALAHFARQEQVTYGYGGYWDAEELTWGTSFRVLVRPVRVCAAHSRALCYPQLGMVSSWYTPRPRTRSLLVVDTPGTSYGSVLAPDPAFGKPLSARRLGDIEVYVYPYDIASRLGRPSCGFTWARPC